MKENQKESNGLNHEEYAAPEYQRFLFETSDLMQGSENTALGGDYSNDGSSSSVVSAFAAGNMGW